MSPRRGRTGAKGGAGASGADPGGPLVMVCLGRRCSALRALAGTQGHVAELQRTVGSTRGAVFVTADCLGRCALAALAGVAHRDGATGQAGLTVWLTGVHEKGRADALADWVRSGGPEPAADPDVGLPVALVEAVAGLGRPPRVARREA